ncbi:class I SAM-dependent methyltransferase [Desulfovibrio sp. OttesenSCG-928-O18]|nr:class I SAM-dependent methyltransferase [Desulfovibrio sp. OttesenSCG-928-O18]
MWDKDAAERYEAWYASARGSFALAREQRLIADVISPWHRRNQTLLEIGCGAGHFLQLFYGGGFDVTGIDKSEAMLEKARTRMGNKATLRCGAAEHLPFDDGEFDYVAMVTSLECMDDPETALGEAFRVATRGVVIAYLNAWSLYRLEHKLKFAVSGLRQRLAARRAAKRGEPEPPPQRVRTLQQARWFDLVEMYRMIRKVSGKRPKVFQSTLFSPSLLWRGVRPFSLSWAHLLPFGAVSVVRVDLLPVCATSIVIRSPKMARAARPHAGVVTMDRYPQCEEK